MKKDNTEKKYTPEQVASAMQKALYKSVLKSLHNNHTKRAAQNVIGDVLDANYKAQVDPDSIPDEKENVMNKSKGSKKLKKFMNIRENKAKNKCDNTIKTVNNLKEKK